MPHFSRAQQGVAFLLGAALLFFWAWRGHHGRENPAPPAAKLKPVFIEVAGAGVRPGVYTFPEPPTLSRVLAQAGGAKPPANGAVRLTSGAKVEVAEAGQCRVGRMDGPRLLTLGLSLDLNKAGAADLVALPGIGPALAKRILDYRQAHGPFQKIEDLEKVSGIGPKKLEKLKPLVVINENGSNN